MMAKGDLYSVEKTLMETTAKDPDTQLTHKALLAVIQYQKCQPCAEHTTALETVTQKLEKVSNKMYYWMGGIAVLTIGVGAAIAYFTK
jgi:hypothetical protein